MQQNHRGIGEGNYSSTASINLRASVHLKTSREKLKETWERRVRQHVSGADAQSSLVLVNSLERFLDEISELLAQEHPSFDALAEQGMSVTHGRERARLSGYFVPQLLKEFSILRSVINETLQSKGLLSYDVRGLIDEAIDSALSKATDEFAAVQQNEIKSALARAESSNRDLDHFAAKAAHDLKSPIASIAGYLDMMHDEYSEKIGSEGASEIELMQRIATRMIDLIDRLLDYSRLLKTEKQFRRVDLNKVVETTLQNLNAVIEKENAKVVYARLPIVMGDVQLLGQLFQNLIANSIKYRGSQRPEIQIGVEEQSDKWMFFIKDNGAGFDPKHKEDIFALFNKLQGTDIPGSGIGLATCRRVVELHGGEIWADSTPGSGATFSFTIPRMPEHSATHH